MKYWDWVERNHERMSKDFPNGEEGFKAVCFLRSFFEQIGIETLSKHHPLHNRLGIGMTSNYLWLVKYARKLLTASQLPGFEGVAKRFSDPREYLAANYEMETALKLHLGGLDVSFCKVTPQPTCDLNVKIDNKVIRIEVTSLNPPHEELLVDALSTRVTVLGFMKGVAAGGFIGKVKSAKILEDVLKQAEQTIDEVRVSRRVKKFNYKGVATVYFAPDDMVNEMPADSRRAFHFSQPSRRPIEEQISRKIREKDRQLQNYPELGVLFLYTRMMDRQTVSNLFYKPVGDVEIMLASYTRFLGLVLTVPHLGIDVASATKTEDLKKGLTDNKLFLEMETAPYQYESSLIWKNLHADGVFPKKFVTALEGYSSNLSKLLPLQGSFSGFKIPK